MPTRRLNFTRRRRIARDDIQIALLPTEDGRVKYDAQLGFTDAFPPEAEVFVEAHHDSRWERFSHGSIGALVQPESTVLRHFGPDEHVLFKVKVVEPGADGHGRIIGLAEKLRPDESGIRTGAKISLLPVEPASLGQRAWRLVLDDAPVLQVNKDVGQWREVAGSHEFRWLVIPAVVREILHSIVVSQKLRTVDDLSDWPQQWLHFALTVPGVGPVPATEDVDSLLEWIDDAVGEFCRTRKLLISGQRIFETEELAS